MKTLEKRSAWTRATSIAAACCLAAIMGCSSPSAETDGADDDHDVPETVATANEVDGSASDSSGPQPHYSFSSELDLDREHLGDLDALAERNVIRALVTYSKTNYFLDGATQRGATYEGLQEFRAFVNEQLGRKTLKVDVVIIPVTRDELIPALTQGLGDIAAANLTITPERLEEVDFSQPFASGVRELVITGPAGPELSSLDDLAGAEVHVRRSSSYWESLETLNADLLQRGLEPVQMVPAEEFLEDEDLLEMVNAGLIPTVIVDSHKASLWQQVFDRIVVHEDLAVRTGGQIAWAFRKASPQLRDTVNAFVRKHKQGTLLGNIIIKRYFQNTRWVRNALADEDRKRFEATVELFRKYGEKYGFDHVMLAALAYQESGIDQSKRSHAGAVGVMQIKPSTAADPNVGIPNVEELEANIHAGTKYLDFLRDRYFSDEAVDKIDRMLFTFAAYNAGPARVRRLRAEAESMDLDPNRWFNNVEVVAARRIGRETVRYVSNISKYYVAYTLALAQLERKAEILNRGRQ